MTIADQKQNTPM